MLLDVIGYLQHVLGMGGFYPLHQEGQGQDGRLGGGDTHAKMSGARWNAETPDPGVVPTFAKEKVIRHRQALS